MRFFLKNKKRSFQNDRFFPIPTLAFSANARDETMREK